MLPVKTQPWQTALLASSTFLTPQRLRTPQQMYCPLCRQSLLAPNVLDLLPPSLEDGAGTALFQDVHNMTPNALLAGPVKDLFAIIWKNILQVDLAVSSLNLGSSR